MVKPQPSLNFLEALNLALTPSDENLKILLDYLFVWFQPAWLAQAIDEHIDPVPYLDQYMHGPQAEWVRRILSLWWEDYLKPVLTDANKLYTYFALDPDLKKLLDTEEGTAYLNYMTQRVYDWVYSILFS